MLGFARTAGNRPFLTKMCASLTAPLAMTRLPPLNTLRVFDAAARHLNFSRAAVELHVTHGAVSRQVAALEEDLQCTLFIRNPRGLTATDEGIRLWRATGAALEILRNATEQVRRRPTPSALRVNVPPTLAMWWLIPRMAALHVEHPELRIEISTSIEPADFESGHYDAAIRRMTTAPKGQFAERFLEGRQIPVCSPAYRDRMALTTIAALAGATLVHTRSEPHAWERWLARNHVRPTGETMTFDQLYFALQAALDSLGVALAPAALVAEQIRIGRLCALAPMQGPATTHYGLLAPRVSDKREAVRTLGAWLIRVARDAGKNG